jgi:hypothetical protein
LYGDKLFSAFTRFMVKFWGRGAHPLNPCEIVAGYF